MAGLTTAANTSHTGYSAPVSQAPVRNTSGPIEPVSDKTEGDNVVGTRRVIIIKCSGPRYAFLLTVVYNTDGEIDGLWAPSVTTGLLIISKSSLPPKKLPFPAFIFDGQLKTRHAPGTSFEPYPIPVLADPKKIIQALDRLRALKTFASADAVNTTTGPQLPKYISAAFGSLDKPWKPGYLRSAYGAICCHKFKPQNQTDDIFLAQILGHKLLGPNASLSVGQSCKDFYVV